MTISLYLLDFSRNGAMITTTLGLFVLFLTSCSPALNNTSSIRYGERFVYDSYRELDFPDFQIKFLGTKQGGRIGNLPLGSLHEFLVTTPEVKKTVIWSSGTGDIGPTVFKINDQCFWLELRHSDRYGRLGDSEAIISRDLREPSSCYQSGRAMLLINIIN
jgi:hypothetical protein